MIYPHFMNISRRLVSMAGMTAAALKTQSCRQCCRYISHLSACRFEKNLDYGLGSQLNFSDRFSYSAIMNIYMKKYQIILFLYATAYFSSACGQDAASLIGTISPGVSSKAPITAQEVKFLPTPCITIGMGRIDGLFYPEGMRKRGTLHLLDLPENSMIKGSTGFHHYCWGMLSKLRYLSAKTEAERKREIRIWREGVKYVIEDTEKRGYDWPYIPHMHTEVAQSYYADKNYHKAIESARVALELDKKQLDSYIVMIDSYIAVGNKSKAKEISVEGLRHVSDSSRLKRKYKSLGGKEPYPEPYKMAEIEPKLPEEVEKVEKATESTINSNSDQIFKKKEAGLPATLEAENPTLNKADTEQPTNEAIVPNKNPYCRFCP
jgi:tetratricopeptide (TPR) repeat protein